MKFRFCRGILHISGQELLSTDVFHGTAPAVAERAWGESAVVRAKMFKEARNSFVGRAQTGFQSVRLKN